MEPRLNIEGMKMTDQTTGRENAWHAISSLRMALLLSVEE